MSQPDKFDEWYHKEWVPHIRDSGGIQAQLKLLTWLVGALLTGQIAIIGALVVVLTKYSQYAPGFIEYPL